MLTVSGGTLLNAASGTIRALRGEAPDTSTETRVLAAEIDNRGVLGVEWKLRLVKSGAEHSNSGSIEIPDGGELTLEGGALTSTGSFEIAGGAQVAVESAALVFSAGGPVGTGALSLVGSRLELVEDFMSSLAVDLSSSSSIEGAVQVTNLSTLRLLGSGNNISSALTNRGLLHAYNFLVFSGAVENTLTGAFRNEVEGTLRVEGYIAPGATAFPSVVTVSTGFENHGLIELTEDRQNEFPNSPSVMLAVSDGTLLNGANGTIRVLRADAPDTSTVARVLAAQLDNHGTVDAQWFLTIDKASAQHVNAVVGQIDVTGGDLTVQQSGTTPTFTNEGNIQIDQDRTMTISGGTCANTGTITGPGTWNAPCAR